MNVLQGVWCLCVAWAFNPTPGVRCASRRRTEAPRYDRGNRLKAVRKVSFTFLESV